MKSNSASAGRFFRRGGFSLVELLVCVVIISILTTISVTSYHGAVDNQDLKYAAPGVAGRLENLRRLAAKEGEVITVEFLLGTDSYRVVRKRRSEIIADQTESMAREGLIKRKLRFLKYEWPDGAETPAMFTFAATAAPMGGKVYFGTGQAETVIQVTGTRITCDLGERGIQ